jgi:hypothetical protein
MNLKDLLMQYQNDFDTIEEIYCSPRGNLYHLGYLTALEKVIKDLEGMIKNG